MNSQRHSKRNDIYQAYTSRKDTNETVEDIAKRFSITSRTIFNIKREIEQSPGFESETSRYDKISNEVKVLRDELSILKRVLFPESD